jgi:group I intron endonuclease
MEIFDFERLYPQGLLCSIDDVPDGWGAVYLITNLVNGKVYVGQTWWSARRRWTKHQTDARVGRKQYFHAAIRKHGAESFALGLLGCAESQEELDAFETLWIILLDATNPSIGYNTKQGGRGGKHTAATKKKISEIVSSPDVRRKQSEYAKKRWETPGEREKQSLITKKQWNSPGRREALISSLKEAWDNPERRKQQSDRTKKDMADPVRREGLMEGHRAFLEDPENQEKLARLYASVEFKVKCGLVLKPEKESSESNT